jgi:hypothetical protein
MADVERQYEYKLQWWVILFTGGFSTLVGAYTIRAVPENLPVLYWTGLVLSLAGAALTGAMAIERLLLRRRIAFTPTSLLLSLPGLFSEVAIDYQAITGLKVSKFGRAGTRYLSVTYGAGRRWIWEPSLRIWEASLPSRAAFEEVCALLTARVRTSEQMGPAEPGAAADRGGM